MESEPSETCKTIAKRACSTDGSHSGSASSHDPLLAYAAAAAHPSAGTHDGAWVRRERSRAQLHDETLRHMRSLEARAALLGRGLGGGARYLHANSLTGTMPTELGELTRMTWLSAGRGWQRGAERRREGASASSMSGLVPALGVGWCRHDMASGAELQGRGQQDAPTFEEAWPNSMLQQVTEWSRGGRNTPTLPGSRSLSME
ncbi:hypothetical protein CYMTET_38869 [Cymbomonas tetramitiformis]|uniref:Uncharacterized protein n=1 Tax=Cymbomonas tetramitiformis TaxID=36881 RepID=A0AAE0CB71_9CHLO|nr:hypothetical protein CYMTET_38869 [Cymbomonas tetramitiformis]